jgi:hypothetical protein
LHPSRKAFARNPAAALTFIDVQRLLAKHDFPFVWITGAALGHALALRTIVHHGH